MRYSEIWAGGMPAAVFLIAQAIVLSAAAGTGIVVVARRFGADLPAALLARVFTCLGALAAVLYSLTALQLPGGAPPAVGEAFLAAAGVVIVALFRGTIPAALDICLGVSGGLTVFALLLVEQANPGAPVTLVTGAMAGVVGGFAYTPLRRMALSLVWLGTGWMPLRPPASLLQHVGIATAAGAVGAVAVLAGGNEPPAGWWNAAVLALLAVLAVGAWCLARWFARAPHEQVTTKEILGCRTPVLEVQGRGPDSGAPLVFLHGYHLSALYWRHVMRLVARLSGRRLVAVSLPSPLSQDATELESPHHSDVDFVLKAIELMCPGQRVLLVGHSIGGWIALEIGTRLNAPLAGIVVLNPAGIVKTWWQVIGGQRLVAAMLRGIARLVPSGLLGWTVARVARKIAGDDPAKPRALRDMAENPKLTRLIAKVGPLMLAQLTSNLDGLLYPTLLCFGKDDPVFPNAAELVPTDRPQRQRVDVVVTDGNHSLQLDPEHPEWLDRFIEILLGSWVYRNSAERPFAAPSAI